MNSDLSLHVLLALAVVVVAGHLVGKTAAVLRQPPVIGEVLAGILLGPSLLGRLAPAAETYLFPPAARPALAVIAELGVVLYMFVVGLEFDPGALRRRAAPLIVTSQASIALPFALGCGLALALYPAFSPTGVALLPFALFMGIAMAITAFPVLARILTDRGLARTELGAAALTCAAINDVTAWCLLAIVVGVSRAALSSALISALLALAFMVTMFAVARPIAVRLAGGRGGAERPSHAAVTWTLAGLLASAVAADAIGIHAIFGAFIFGAIIPADSAIARALTLRRMPVVTILLVPAFFALTGLRTEIGLMSGPREWAIGLVVVLLAIAGKFGGTVIAGRLVGMGWGFAARLGILMNTRGLMELVVLNVGLDIGVITPTLFTIMVVMAVATTALTGPLLDAIGPGGAGLVVEARGDDREDGEEGADA